MKTVEVHYFAAFRDATGVSREAVSSQSDTVNELFAECVARWPGLETETESLVAINDVMVSWDSPYADGDEILFFPPVAGG